MLRFCMKLTDIKVHLKKEHQLQGQHTVAEVGEADSQSKLVIQSITISVILHKLWK